ncbi:MAG: sigma-70 family RNA polymerase sigma factor [Lutibacter sp.]|nr:sigma-70 family RNA polymerase sigma factor [Lutibacter sp.]
MSKTVFINNKIVEDCKQNNAKAQMQLYDMYCQAMFTIAKRYVKDSFIAEDMMQDSFIKVFKNIQSFKGEVTIGAWIKRIVINQCIDYLKKKRIELVSIEETALTIADDGDWTVKEEVSVTIVTSAINSLPEKYKVVLNLFLIEGYDHQEIAKVLNITEVNSRSQLMRGKNKLRGQLKQYNYA